MNLLIINSMLVGAILGLIVALIIIKLCTEYERNRGA